MTETRIYNGAAGAIFIRNPKYGVIETDSLVVIDRPDDLDHHGLIGRLHIQPGMDTVIVKAGVVHVNVYPCQVRPLKLGERIGDPEANAHLNQIAEMVGEGEDVGAAWESVQAIITERDNLKTAAERVRDCLRSANLTDSVQDVRYEIETAANFIAEALS
ncbi:hypothetical protein CcrMagneto_gp305 [Caulobacter virus Magneto]|uniref:hypothetical protein n=1 Tax=Caulobacter virus Magneto TaxID=1211642 RepID=UPI00028BAB5D|nr:hypothetical protein CcrMagneto_gp305 [Caulobacter virus Magneto]AFU87475.1 hypothetical protein CcrMagneto_gp305 [Caulobacter virus Magneto]